MTLLGTRLESPKDRRMLVCIVGWLRQTEHIANIIAVRITFKVLGIRRETKLS